MVLLLKARFQILPIFLLLRGLEVLLGGPTLVHEGISIHDIHVVNIVRTLLPEAIND